MNERNEREQVSLAETGLFVRTFCHDIRNMLNGIDLHLSALEPKAEIQSARDLVRTSVYQIKRVSTALAEPKIMPILYPAAYFIEDLRARIEKQNEYREERFEWEIHPTQGNLRIDFEAVAEAAGEIITNAIHFSEPDRRIKVQAGAREDGFALNIINGLGTQQQFATDPGMWGYAPFFSTERGHYGLGLYRARRLIEAHDGRLRVEYRPDPGDLVASIFLPISATSSQ